jgi:hypothetical protein
MEASHQNKTPVVPQVINMTLIVPKTMFPHGSKEKLCTSDTVTLTAYLLFLSHLKTATTTDSDGIREHGGKEISEMLE